MTTKGLEALRVLIKVARSQGVDVLRRKVNGCIVPGGLEFRILL